MSIRVRRPATERLELSNGDYLLVKQDLTAGETREIAKASTRPVKLPAPGEPTPTLEMDPFANSVAMVMAYVLDWSFQDADARPIVIADQPAAIVRAALDNIDADAFMEIAKAILAHHTARAAALVEEKKTRPGPSRSDRTLMSVG